MANPTSPSLTPYNPFKTDTFMAVSASPPQITSELNIRPNYTTPPITFRMASPSNERPTYDPCQCVCHSRKIFPIMLENIDNQQKIMTRSVELLHTQIDLLQKVVFDIKGWDSAQRVAVQILKKFKDDQKKAKG